ncbi:MAG TPA: peptide chain release factor 3 [Verrucomicrobiales bacterium]|nr:peptide chain release factor 3 [Verrucomicrobiales bacterium]
MSAASEIARRRTFAIISHPDAGKTTLTEKLLLYGGAVQLAGSVTARKNQRATTSDWMELEKQRGISVSSTVLQFDYRDCVVNLLDTPGHKDFSEDTYRVLTAVDAAVMVIDAGKGIEAQTLKLFEVCRRRGVPIFTFMNKLDRPARPPLELLDELERVLGIASCPINWPLGDGVDFKGVYDRETRAVHLFERTVGGKFRAPVNVRDIHDDTVRDALPPLVYARVCEELELLEVVGAPFSMDNIRKGQLTPVFFGSAMNNFGVQLMLDRFLDLAPPPAPRQVGEEILMPENPAFSGFVFKIQANMDPKHRDRIAFFRICSGRYTSGMKLRHVRMGREMKLANALTFMANERVLKEDGVAGDIIGIHNHGQLQIGDTLTEGEGLGFKGIPYFSPELFRAARLRDPLKTKQLQKGLQELGEEGAIQVFEQEGGNMLLGAVGQLQFEVVAQRLKDEYKVDAIFEAAEIYTARWLTFPDEVTRRNFEREQFMRVGKDVDGNPVYLASTRYNLDVTREKWPKVGFHATREHGQVLG